MRERSSGIPARMGPAFFGAHSLWVKWTLCQKVALRIWHKPSRFPRQLSVPTPELIRGIQLAYRQCEAAVGCFRPDRKAPHYSLVRSSLISWNDPIRLIKPSKFQCIDAGWVRARTLDPPIKRRLSSSVCDQQCCRAVRVRHCRKILCPAPIPLDFTAKASIAVSVDGLLLGRRAPGLSSAGLVVVQASRQARCGFGERGHGHQANERESKDEGRCKGRYGRQDQVGRRQRARTATSKSAGTVTLEDGSH